LLESFRFDNELKGLLEQLDLLRNYEKRKQSLNEAITYIESLLTDSPFKEHPSQLFQHGLKLNYEQNQYSLLFYELEKMVFAVNHAPSKRIVNMKLIGWIYRLSFMKKQQKRMHQLGLNTTRIKENKTLHDFTKSLEQYKSGVRLLMLLEERDSFKKQMTEIKGMKESELKSRISKLIEEKVLNDILLLKCADEERKISLTDNDIDDLKQILTEKNAFYGSNDKFAHLTKFFPVILCTNQSVPSSIPIDFSFDLVIIDEASQCIIPASLPAVKRARRLLVVGDDNQLEPVVDLSAVWDELLMEEHLLKTDNNENSIYKYSFRVS